MSLFSLNKSSHDCHLLRGKHVNYRKLKIDGSIPSPATQEKRSRLNVLLAMFQTVIAIETYRFEKVFLHFYNAKALLMRSKWYIYYWEFVYLVVRRFTIQSFVIFSYAEQRLSDIKILRIQHSLPEKSVRIRYSHLFKILINEDRINKKYVHSSQ